jgi:endonuclease G
LPQEFWRVIVFIENQKVKSKGFLLIQSLDELEAFDLDEFKVFQVALTEIEAQCGLSFPTALKAADAVRERLRLQPEALSQRRPPVLLRDILIGLEPFVSCIIVTFAGINSP